MNPADHIGFPCVPILAFASGRLVHLDRDRVPKVALIGLASGFPLRPRNRKSRCPKEHDTHPFPGARNGRKEFKSGSSDPARGAQREIRLLARDSGSRPLAEIAFWGGLRGEEFVLWRSWRSPFPSLISVPAERSMDLVDRPIGLRQLSGGFRILFRLPFFQMVVPMFHGFLQGRPVNFTLKFSEFSIHLGLHSFLNPADCPLLQFS